MPRIVSTLSYPRRPQWNARVEVIDPFVRGRPRPSGELVSAAGRCDVMVLDGSMGIRRATPTWRSPPSSGSAARGRAS